MPIKIIRDDTTEGLPPDEQVPPPPRIVVESSDVTPEPPVRVEEPVKTVAEPASSKTPAQTTWLIVGGQCTMTTRWFSISFRREGDTYVLKSVDRAHSEGSAKKYGAVDGSFTGWDDFACPHCGHPGDQTKATKPVVYCECQQLFCAAKGLAARRVRGRDELWWRCPSCKVYKPITRDIESLDGTAIKGK